MIPTTYTEREETTETMPLYTESQTIVRRNSASPERKSRSWLRKAWVLHFILSLLVILFGAWNNHGSRKYIPVDSSKVGDECNKAFLNVMASSEDDPEALVCCSDQESSNISDLCPPKTKWLPFAGRLAKFPDAWLLPLFPLILRIFFQFYQVLSAKGRIAIDYTMLPAVRRLILYAILMNLRGWVLYVGFNKLEDSIVKPIPGSCWYREFLYENQDGCHGRIFDFSDHIVLYFAQLLPIAFMEVLYSFESPYWTSPWRSDRFFHMLPLGLMAGMAYLYFITFLGAFETASYFHTGAEVFSGFVVSLPVHWPMYCLQCSDSERCSQMRRFFFGSPKAVK